MSDILDNPAAPVNVEMRRSTSLVVPTMPSLAAAHELRHAHAREAGALAELLGRAYPEEIWEVEETKQELFHDGTIEAVLVVTSEHRLLATASLQVHKDDSRTGQVRWVATEEDARRQGLARALVIRLLDTAKNAGCAEAILKTSTDLLGAISLYLQLGFEPFIRNEEEKAAWKTVLSQISSKT